MTAELELWQSEPDPFQQALADATSRVRELAAAVPDWSGFDYLEHGRELETVAESLKSARDLPSYREALGRWTATMETAAARRLIALCRDAGVTLRVLRAPDGTLTLDFSGPWQARPLEKPIARLAGPICRELAHPSHGGRARREARSPSGERR